jgi:hypothetical protein
MPGYIDPGSSGDQEQYIPKLRAASKLGKVETSDHRQNGLQGNARNGGGY